MLAEALQEYLWDSTGREASAHGKISDFCHCSQQTRLPFDISCRPSRAWPLLLPSSTCRMFATRRGAQVQSILKSTSGNLIQCSRSLTLNESGATGASCSASTGAPLVWRSSCDGWVASKFITYVGKRGCDCGDTLGNIRNRRKFSKRATCEKQIFQSVFHDLFMQKGGQTYPQLNKRYMIWILQGLNLH